MHAHKTQDPEQNRDGTFRDSKQLKNGGMESSDKDAKNAFGGVLRFASRAMVENQRKSSQRDSAQGGSRRGLGVLVVGTVRQAQAPRDQVAGVESDAEQIRRDEAELRGAHANDTDDRTIHGGNDPALPEFPAEQDGGEDGENAGDVVQTQQVVK